MARLTPEQIIHYLHRSYTAADGLWFMKVQERWGFDAALDVDEDVWRVLPKIQARKLKELTGRTDGLDALEYCLGAKLEIEGFTFEMHRQRPDVVEFQISGCPWLEMLKQSGRESLARTVAERICPTEYTVWSREFGVHFCSEMGQKMCAGSKSCILKFTSEPDLR